MARTRHRSAFKAERRRAGEDAALRPRTQAERDAAELADTEDFLATLAEITADKRHPDTIGISRRPEPKSIHVPVQGRFGSIPKPKSPAGKPEAPNPYAYSRHGLGRWQQRG